MFILAKQINGKIEARGVFDDPDQARSQAISGQWLIIPVEANRIYGSNIIDEGMTGAVWRSGSSDEITGILQSMRDDFLAFKNSVQQRLDALENPT